MADDSFSGCPVWERLVHEPLLLLPAFDLGIQTAWIGPEGCFLVMQRDSLLQIPRVIPALPQAPLFQGIILPFEERMQRSGSVPSPFRPVEIWPCGCTRTGAPFGSADVASCRAGGDPRQGRAVRRTRGPLRRSRAISTSVWPASGRGLCRSGRRRCADGKEPWC